MGRGAVNAILMACAFYLFACGFIMTVCVVMSNAELSPEISLDLVHRPVRSIALILLAATPFGLMMSIGRGARWSWIGMQLFSAAICGVGVYCAIVDHGWFEAFAGTGNIRHDAGIVYAVSSACVFAASLIPGVRQQIADGT